MMDNGGGGGGGRGGLLGDIHKGFQLKRVDSAQQPKQAPPPAADDGGGNLADTLKKAMIAHRKDIVGNDAQGADDDEWD